MMTSCCDIPQPAEDRRYRQVLWAVLLLNAAMFVVEVAAGYISASVSVLADALDFFGDTVNYGISLYVLRKPLVWRARATLLKGATMAAFGLMVLGQAAWRAYLGEPPQAHLMGIIGVLALLVNIACTWLLFRHRAGDSNRESVWLCSRNDALANIGILVAALGVYLTGTVWPDIAIATLIAGVCLYSAVYVIRKALSELGYHPAGD